MFRYILFFTLIILCALVCFIVLGIGRYSVSYAEIWGILSSPNAADLGQSGFVILEVRLPRVLLGLFVGAGLSVAGASFQAVFKNPLASPDILGVASGAGFGAVLALLFGFGIYIIMGFAFVFGIATLLLVLLVARDNSNTVMIILSGIVISALFQSFISIVKYVADPQDTLPAITYWLMGSLQVSSLADILPAIIIMMLCSSILLIFSWKHNLLMLDDNEAQSLGINIAKMRLLMIALCTLIVACVVSLCGIIGWVGLLVPHLARLLFGGNNAIVLPSSCVIGAIFLVCIDTLSRSLSASEIPISILSACIGAPFFIAILYTKGGIRL